MKFKLQLLGACLIAALNTFANGPVICGADATREYIDLLKGKRVALVVNQTSRIGNTLLPDTLKKLHVNLVAIFAPEHGFRGNYDAGAKVANTIDSATHVPVYSLYGSAKKPTPNQMANIDIVVYDIQDVGVRFYTYISTLHYIMEACAECNLPLVVLDRPNPQGLAIDGPVLETALQSFVGMHPIPVLYSLTVGELANMINGEKWLTNSNRCKLTVIKLKNWTHNTPYILPVKPSPNLPTPQSIALYPSLCFFEGTNISVGRGTDTPFEVIGAPDAAYGTYSFTPRSMPGSANNPPHKDVQCFGLNLRTATVYGLDLKYLLDFYALTPKGKFFTNAAFFDKLAGTRTLRTQIEAGSTENEIRASWQKQLESYKLLRKKYLLYK